MTFRALPFVTLALSCLFTAACSTLVPEADGGTFAGSDRDRTCEAEATVRFENCVASNAQFTRPPIARVIVASSIRSGANGPDVCVVPDQAWLSIGTYGGGGGGGNPTRAVDSGGDEAGDRVDVSCSVVPEADGSYRMQGEATRARSGTLRVSGVFRPENAPQPGITLELLRPDLGVFTQTDCVARYDVNPAAGITDGRAWFRVSCPRIKSPATR
jgi:hypothetical protein